LEIPVGILACCSSLPKTEDAVPVCVVLLPDAYYASLFIRYLIVIDDIWDENAWNIINCALPKDRSNSTVITTTRIDTVARVCCSNHCDYVYKMHPLSNQDSRRLFFTRIFGSEDACPLFLEKVAVKILKRCGGLPLAIITISSLLACQRNKLKEQWEQILNSLGSNMELNPTMEGMRQILNLSYIHLPRYLKTCMLYLGIYPEDRIIEKNDLVRQWVAQGFISTAHGQDQEDVAEGYYNELVNRSIVQPSYANGHIVSCIVHDMMLDLIIHKCRDENFMLAIDSLQTMTGLHDKVRRLSLNMDGVIDGTILGTISLSQVRALARFGTSTYAPPLMEFKHLRVLILVYSGRNQESLVFDIGGMCHLFQLRYLKIEAHGEIVLSSKFRGLQQLETLEINSYGHKVQVPSDIVHLRHLLHLIIHVGTILPDGIGNMKSLISLGRFDFGINSLDTIKGIGELTNLKDLQICCADQSELIYSLDGSISMEKMFDGMEARRTDALRSSIGKLCNLKYLSVVPPGVCSDISELHDVLSSVSPSPSHLQRLRLLYCWLPRVPKWIRDLHNLSYLDLAIQEVLQDDVGILSQLPSLIDLYLHIQGIPKEKVVFSRIGFPVLEYLTVGCSRPSVLTFEAGAMPKLQWLKIYFEPRLWRKYGGAPTGIEHLSGLKEIYVRIGCSDDDSDIRAAESALRNAMDVHPGRPVTQIDLSGLCWYFDEVKDLEDEELDENVNSSTSK
jgi:hypothetical protein